MRRDALVLAGVSLGAAVLFYLPFWFRVPSFGGIPFDRQGMERVYGMWDGPLYVTAAGTLYDPNGANPLYSWGRGAPSDYAERFPLYPVAIRLLSPVLGYWAGALAIAVAASTGVTLLLYAFLRRFGTAPSAAFWVALAAIFWPPRGFLYRYVIMPEPLFILGFLGAVYAYKSARFWRSGLLGALAVAARPNGFLVIAGFGVLALRRLVRGDHRSRLLRAVEMAGLGLMPLTLAAIFLWHQLLFGDWLASVHSTTFVRPEWRLYPALAYFGVGDEGIPYLFLLALAGILELARRGSADLAVLGAAFYVPALAVPTDVSRYLLPILPFVFFLAGERLLGAVPMRVAVILSVPMVYLYAWTTLLSPGYQSRFEPLYHLLR